MPRPSRGVPVSRRHIILPDSCWKYLEEQNWDPVRGTLRYGGLSHPIERLIKQDMLKTQALNNLAETKND